MSMHRMLDSGRAALALLAAGTLRRMDDPTGLDRVLEIMHQGGAQRAAAIRVLSGFRVRAAVLPLINALMDPDLTARHRALSGLQAVLGSLFPYRRLDLRRPGYRPQAPAATRKAAARQILAWWNAHRADR